MDCSGVARQRSGTRVKALSDERESIRSPAARTSLASWSWSKERPILGRVCDWEVQRCEGRGETHDEARSLGEVVGDDVVFDEPANRFVLKTVFENMAAPGVLEDEEAAFGGSVEANAGYVELAVCGS